MKKIKYRESIIITMLIFTFLPFIFSRAETVEKNGMIFVVGKHEPQKRVNEAVRKYKNFKSLEVYKQPDHGRELYDYEKELNKFDKDIVYVNEITKDESVINDLGEDNNDSIKDLEKLIKNNKKVRSSKEVKNEDNNIFNKILNIFKEIWFRIISLEQSVENIYERLYIIEEKLGIGSVSEEIINSNKERFDNTKKIKKEKINNEDVIKNDNYDSTDNESVEKNTNNKEENNSNNEKDNHNIEKIENNDVSIDKINNDLRNDEILGSKSEEKIENSDNSETEGIQENKEKESNEKKEEKDRGDNMEKNELVKKDKGGVNTHDKENNKKDVENNFNKNQNIGLGYEKDKKKNKDLFNVASENQQETGDVKLNISNKDEKEIIKGELNQDNNSIEENDNEGDVEKIGSENKIKIINNVVNII